MCIRDRSYSGRRVGADVVNRSRLLFAFGLLVVAHWALEGAFFPTGVEPFRWGWLGVSSVLGLVLGDAFLFRAYVLIGPRLSMLLMSTVPIFSTLFGWWLFGEVVTGPEMAGIVLAVAGVGWVVTDGQSDLRLADRRVYRRGLLFGLLGALGQVANLVTARYALVGDFSALSATLIRIAIGAVIVWAVAALRGQVSHTPVSYTHLDRPPAHSRVVALRDVRLEPGIALDVEAQDGPDAGRRSCRLRQLRAFRHGHRYCGVGRAAGALVAVGRALSGALPARRSGRPQRDPRR